MDDRYSDGLADRHMYTYIPETKINFKEMKIVFHWIRASAHGTMARRVDPSWWTHLAISGVTKAVICAILSVGWFR